MPLQIAHAVLLSLRYLVPRLYHCAELTTYCTGGKTRPVQHVQHFFCLSCFCEKPAWLVAVRRLLVCDSHFGKRHAETDAQGVEVEAALPSGYAVQAFAYQTSRELR